MDLDLAVQVFVAKKYLNILMLCRIISIFITEYCRQVEMLLRSFDERRKLRVAKDSQLKKSFYELTNNMSEPVSPADSDVDKLVFAVFFSARYMGKSSIVSVIICCDCCYFDLDLSPQSVCED